MWLPAHLPRERVVLPSPCVCPCCGGRLAKLGEDITETLEVIPRQWKVVQTVREKFTCRSCEAITQPPAPFHPIARGREQQGAAGGGDRQIAKFIEDDCVGLDQLAGQITGFSVLLFLLQLGDQIDRAIEANAFAAMDGSHAQTHGQMGFPVPVPPTRIRLCTVCMKAALAGCSICACGNGVSAQSIPVRSRCTGALLDRLTHHVSILTMNGDSYRLKQSTSRRRATAKAEQNQTTGEIVDPDTGQITTG